MQKNNNIKPLTQSIKMKKTKPYVRTNSRKRPTFSTRSDIRVLSLSEVLKRQIIIEPEAGSSDDKSYPNSESSSDSDQVQCLVRLIRMEIRRFISKMKFNKRFVKKSDFTAAIKASKTSPSKTLLYNTGEKLLQKHDYTASASDNITKKQDGARNGVENNSLSEQDEKWTTEDEEEINICRPKRNESDNVTNKIIEHNIPQGHKDKVIFENSQDGNVKSVHIMLTMNKNSQNYSTSEKSSKTKHQSVDPENKIVQNLTSRLNIVEAKLSTIDDILLKTGLAVKQSKPINSLNEIKPKNHLENHDKFNLNVKNQMEKEISPIEFDVKKSRHKIPSVLKSLHESNSNIYDKPYHPWRHHKRNSLHYKKSHRSLHFNAQPKLLNTPNITPNKYNLT